MLVFTRNTTTVKINTFKQLIVVKISLLSLLKIRKLLYNSTFKFNISIVMENTMYILIYYLVCSKGISYARS
jgi:hypothetical protein